MRLLILLLLVSCTTQNKLVEKNFFEGKKGCFLLYNMKTGAFDGALGETCKERYPACSSFKVPLAVMAFDSGVLSDENQVLKWDGVIDARKEVNQDHNAKTWMRDSVVWFSQRITPKLGSEKFQKYLDDFQYGNRNFTAGIKTAWLVSPRFKEDGLEISAYEQVEFMKRLWTNALPVSSRSMKLTQEITYLETSPLGYRLSGKTGSNFYDEERKVSFGWFIAHLQKGDEEYIVVTNLSDLHPSEEKTYGGLRAKHLTKEILASRGLW